MTSPRTAEWTNTRATERAYALAALLSAAVAVGVLATALHAAQVSPTTWITPARQTTPADTAAPAAAPADGKHFGSITAAYVGPPELVFEAREVLRGEEASAAARADGVPVGAIGDFYIRRAGQPAVSLPVADDVVVTRVDCSGEGCVEGAPTTYDEFTRSFDAAADVASPNARLFQVTVADGHVVGIDEQYLP